MDTIERARSLIEQRLAEIDSERGQLTKALESLKGPDAKATARSMRARGIGSKPARKGRRASRGQRQTEFLAALREYPGATMAEIAQKMGVRPQQLYPIAHRLVEAGAITKGENGFVPATDGAAKAGSNGEAAATASDGGSAAAKS